MFAAPSPSDAPTVAPFAGPHAMRYRGFSLQIAPHAGGFRWAVHHDGLLLHADRHVYRSAAAAARAARAHVDDALGAFDAALGAGSGALGVA